jgi:hypothetical protein
LSRQSSRSNDVSLVYYAEIRELLNVLPEDIRNSRNLTLKARLAASNVDETVNCTGEGFFLKLGKFGTEDQRLFVSAGYDPPENHTKNWVVTKADLHSDEELSRQLGTTGGESNETWTKLPDLCLNAFVLSWLSVEVNQTKFIGRPSYTLLPHLLRYIFVVQAVTAIVVGVHYISRLFELVGGYVLPSSISSCHVVVTRSSSWTEDVKMVDFSLSARFVTILNPKF